MKKYFLILMVFVLANTLFAQIPKLSDNSSIRLITCGPGQGQLYEAFGHSAIRVSDPMLGIDYVYNYGVFDFDQPFFYLNFARGYLNYKLDRQGYGRFVDIYVYYNRSITEQLLNLNLNEKQKLFEFLEVNLLPENQYYYYDYFYDNCSTRIRDALVSVFGESLIFNEEFVTEAKTIRELTDDCLDYQPWGDLGIDICLGLPMDVEASPYMHMFLPEYLYNGVDRAVLKEGENTKQLVSEVDVVFRARPEIYEMSFITPVNIFYALLLLMLLVSIFGYKNNKHKKWIDVIWFSVLGLLGLFLFLLWVATNHKAAAGNLNLLWAWPLYLPGVWLLLKKQKWSFLFFRYHFFLSVLVVLFWFLLPQKMHFALFPIALISMIRTFIIQKNFKDAA